MEEVVSGIQLGEAVSCLDETGVLTTAAKETVAAVKEVGAILATGHISLNEAHALVPYAIDCGISKIVLTHVSSRHNRVPVQDQQMLIELGKQRGTVVFAEHCAITWIDGKEGVYDSKRDFMDAIVRVGPENCLISSDAGRVVRPETNKPTSPQECLSLFCTLLLENGVSLAALETMLVKNPRLLLGV